MFENWLEKWINRIFHSSISKWKIQKKRVTNFSFFILKSKIGFQFYSPLFFIFQFEMNVEPVGAFCATGVVIKEGKK